MPSSRASRLTLLVNLTAATGVVLAQVDDGDAARAALAPSGTMRVVFLATNPMQGHVDPVTGEVTGIAADIANEIGRRLGLPVEITPIPGVPGVIEAVASGTADIGFLAYDPTRAAQIEFAQIYVLGHNSYVVRSGSPIMRLADADRADVRIGARDGISVDLFLIRTIEHAELVHLPRSTTEEEATRLLLANDIDAYAANTERLAVMAANEPGIRVVDGSLMSAKQSIVVTHGNATGLAYLNEFIDGARDSGLLERIVARYGMAGVEVAPKGAR